MTITRYLAAAGAVAFAATALSAGAHAQKLSLKRITLGTNPAGSVYYLIGGGFTKLWQEKLKVRSTPQPHAGSSVYIPLIHNGEVTMGLNSSLDSAMSYAGRSPYKKRYVNMRAMARIWILPYAYVVKASSPYRTLEDLKGKRVVVEIKPNIPLGHSNRAYLATGGIREKDVVSIASGGVVHGLQMVQEGRADATNVALGMPQVRKMHASIPGGIRVIPVGRNGTDEFIGKEMPGMSILTVGPGKTRPFIKAPMKIATFDAYINIGKGVSAEDVYILTKTLHTNWKKLQKDYPPLRGVGVDKLAPARNVVPYHDGAIRYYKEAGLWTAANDARQKQVMK
ncbi:MAG: TAXI family TRAP transporter solute-binding subunit [Hyphomicrobiales bacterium]|nr:TAXI family TRAP transporter solute-binding subunit [Hyphomicrobiales bacterium]